MMEEKSRSPRRNERDRQERRRHDRRDHASGSESSRREHRTRQDEVARRDRSQKPRERLRDDSRDRRRDRRNDERPSARREYSRSRSPPRKRRSSRSPPPKRRRPSYGDSKSPPPIKSRAPLPSQDDSFRGEVGPGGDSGGKLPEKQKPNFKPTGLLAKEANTVQGTNTVLKYHEPPEARKPSSKDQWRMYIFKKQDLVDTIYLYQRSVWLMGRDEKVTDLRLEHPSISKQHAVIQFRYITTMDEYGDKRSKVKPYLIDLESANGTRLNGKKIGESRYVELVDQDVISFGDSEREYVLMLPSDAK